MAAEKVQTCSRRRYFDPQDESLDGSLEGGMKQDGDLSDAVQSDWESPAAASGIVIQTGLLGQMLERLSTWYEARLAVSLQRP